MTNLGDPALIAVGLPIGTAQIAPSHAHTPITQHHNAHSVRLQPITDQRMPDPADGGGPHMG